MRTKNWKPPPTSLYDGRTCIGYLLPDPAGIEAFDHNGRSLGVHPNQAVACAAIARATSTN